MNAARIVVPALREDRSRFASVRDSRVLIYWPHGLGDWVHFGAIAPLLEPSNVYAMTRIGDDYVSIMEGNAPVIPLFSGTLTPATSAPGHAEHMGLTLRRCNGKPVALDLAEPLHSAVAAFSPSLVLWTDYPETEGRTAYPFHSKARNLARLLVAPQRLATFDLARPLPNAIDFSVPASAQRALDEALARFAPAGTRLAAISRAGVTAARKNWSLEDARTFVTRMRAGDRRWHFVSMDGDEMGEGVAGFRALFGTLDAPFARLYKALCNRLDLFVGIPAGPLHLTMARGGVPTVGLWLTHHPDWYDEPNARAIHLIGRYVRDRGFDRRPASTSKPPALAHRVEYLDSLTIGAERVVDTARALL